MATVSIFGLVCPHILAYPFSSKQEPTCTALAVAGHPLGTGFTQEVPAEEQFSAAVLELLGLSSWHVGAQRLTRVDGTAVLVLVAHRSCPPGATATRHGNIVHGGLVEPETRALSLL